MLHKRSFILIIALSGTMFACSSKPSTGQQMITQGSDAVEYGEKWQKGQSQIAKGNKKIKHGKKMVSKGQHEIQDGEKLLEKGEKLKKQSEKHFHEEFPEVEIDS